MYTKILKIYLNNSWPWYCHKPIVWEGGRISSLKLFMKIVSTLFYFRINETEMSHIASQFADAGQ